MDISKLSADQLIQSVKEIGFKVFEKPYDMTMVAIRSKNQLSNSFDDFFIPIYRNASRAYKIEPFTSTTDSGLYYLKNPMKKAGTAILVPNVQTRGSHRFQKNGHKGYTAFRQIKPMPIVRNNAKDGKLHFELYENPKNIIYENCSANIHRATPKELLASTVVGKWSAACQVLAEYFEWQRLCQLARRQMSAGHGDTFSFGIIEEKYILT